MHGKHRCHCWVLQHGFFKPIGAEVVAILLDIYKQGIGAKVADYFRGGGKGVGCCRDLGILPYSRRLQAQVKSGGGRAYRQGVIHAGPCGKLLFEALGHLSCGQPTAAQHRKDRLLLFPANRGTIEGDEISGDSHLPESAGWERFL